MNQALFGQAIYENWAGHFGSPLATFQRSGTSILPLEKYTGDKVLVFWHIGMHTFVQLDPDYTEQVERVLSELPEGTALDGDALRRAWGQAAIGSHDRGLVYYLYPEELPDYHPPIPFVLRQLSAADGGLMQALHGANSPEDVEEGFVEVNHQVVFGCLVGGQLVAAASGYERAGFMDIGVLTHPKFRRKGLGRAVVGAICDWSQGNGFIAQYRCNEQNFASRGVAEGLNFKRYFSSESLWMI